MKNLLLLSVVILGLTTSCEKDGDYVLIDTVRNQGATDATVNGVTVEPTGRVELDHTGEIVIRCGEGCKVNVNGGIYYESGHYVSDRPSKKY